MLRAVTARASGLDRLGATTAPCSRPSAGTRAGKRTVSRTTPHPPRRVAPRPPAPCEPCSAAVGPAPPVPAHARLPFLSACGSAHLYLNLWWFNALLQRHLPRDSGCTLFSVLQKNFSVQTSSL